MITNPQKVSARNTFNMRPERAAVVESGVVRENKVKDLDSVLSTSKCHGCKPDPVSFPNTTSTNGRLPSALAPLIAQPRWVLWRWKPDKKGKLTKPPYKAAAPSEYASSTDPETWSDFATAVAAERHADGIGYCLLNSDISAFDIDDCISATGNLHPWAMELVKRAASYTEITTSGTGLRIIGYGSGHEVHRKQTVVDGVSLEAYRKAKRFIVMTGNVLPGTPAVLANIDAVMDAVVAELDGAPSNDARHADEGTRSVRLICHRRHRG